MTQKRILSLVLAFMMVLTLLPTATAESQQEDTVVYGYSIGGTEFYTCDQNGVPNLESPIDPTTITHLYLTPKAGDWRISPLMMTDKSNLQSVVLLDPEGNGLTVERYAFSFFPNLTSVDMSKVTVNMELEVFFHTAIRSFTLPDGTADECLFQQCYTIEEIKNPTQNDVTLVIHHEEVTIPAGETWYADFGIASDKTYCVPGQPLQEQLYAVGADESQPLVWSLDSDYYYANPEGITLSEDGILSGISPQDVEYVYVVVTNGEQTAKGSVYLNTGGVFSVTTELPQGISVKSGPVGENLCSYRQEAAFVFDVDPDYFFPEGTVLVPTVYTINDEGEQDLLSPQNYVFYNDILFLPACTTERDLHIRMDVDYPSLSLEEAIEQAAKHYWDLIKGEGK